MDMKSSWKQCIHIAVWWWWGKGTGSSWYYPRVQGLWANDPSSSQGVWSLQSLPESPNCGAPFTNGPLALPAHGKPKNTGVGSLSLLPSPADLPHPGIEPGSPALQVDSLPTELWGKPLHHTKEIQNGRWTVYFRSFTVQKPKSTLCLCKVNKGFGKCPPCS